MLPAATGTHVIRTARAGEEHELSQLICAQARAAYRAGEPRAVEEWLIDAYRPEVIRRRIERDDCLLLVCVNDAGRIQGTSYAELQHGPFDTDALLGGTYLSHHARGLGLTVALHARVVAWLQARQAVRVLAYVHADNARARQLLEVVGFTHAADAPGALIRGLVWSQMVAEVPAG